MFWIFELANNHQGSVQHAKRIIDEFSVLAKRYKITAGIKLQLRHLDTFIHDEFKDSELKYVKRFKETRLSDEAIGELIGYARGCGLTTVATPFDNESLHLFKNFDIDIIKVASCSVDDWELLRDIVKIDRRVIISTAGASLEVLDRVYSMFKAAGRDFAFMHCVAEYPTPHKHANLKRIAVLKERYPDIEVGFSSHEPPAERSIVPLAVLRGATIVEKHVGTQTDEIKLNAYSCTSDQMESCIHDTLAALDADMPTMTKEGETLRTLKRGIYAAVDIFAGDEISEYDVYLAMPCQDRQADASFIDLIIGQHATRDIELDKPIRISDCVDELALQQMRKYHADAMAILQKAGLQLDESDLIELSAHNGLGNFASTGAVIINKVNREYCKKLIIQFGGQSHPRHHHIKKEETFELLSGDCELVLNDKKIQMQKNKTYLIARGVDHSFSSIGGCVVEEISTTHVPGDSIYADPNIFKMKLADRKFRIPRLF